ncbi:MAG: hypothetical protein ACJA2Q_002142 [Pseudohongiellaceae bacterium]|jgi:hypothetical protein
MRDQDSGAAGFRASLLAALNPMLAAEFIPKLTYFDSRGSGEVIRLMMEESGTFFNERRLHIDEWPAFKSNFTFSQLPVYEEGDIFLNNAGEIYRHLAQKLNLFGQTPAEKLCCELAHKILVTAQDKLFDLYLDPAFADARSTFEKTELVETLKELENFYFNNPYCTGFWVGEKISYIDIFAWDYLDSVRPLAPHALDRFQGLAQFKLGFEKRPNISAYLNSNRRPATLMLSLSFFGGTPETS